MAIGYKLPRGPKANLTALASSSALVPFQAYWLTDLSRLAIATAPNSFTEVYADGGGAGGVTDGDKGDITVSASGATWTVDNGAITLPKLTNATAGSVLIGRAAAGAGPFQQITLGSNLTMNAGGVLDAVTQAAPAVYDSDVIAQPAGWIILKGEDLATVLLNLDYSMARMSINPMDLGATGDGVADDTTFLNQAISILSSRGGGNVIITHRHLLSANITVSRGVHLVGPHLPAGEALNWHTLHAGALLLPREYSLTLFSGSGLNGLLIYPPGLTTTQTSAQVGAWTGTAVYLADYTVDQVIENNLIMGYGNAIMKQGGLAGVNGINRTRIHRNNIDCVNGITYAKGYDVPYITQNHIWPFASTQATVETNNAHLLRGGSGITIGDVSDWAQIAHNFVYGWMIAYDIQGGDQINLHDNGSDYVPEMSSNGNIGFKITGNANQVSMMRNRSAASNHAFVINPTGEQGAVMMQGNRVWACDGNAIHVITGKVRISDQTVHGPSTANKTPRALRVETGATYVSITDSFIENVGDFINSASTTIPVIQKNNYLVPGTVTAPFIAPFYYEQTVADGMTFDANANVLYLKNTTGATANLGTVLGAAAFNDKLLTLVGHANNNAPIVIYNGASMDLTGDVVLGSGDTLTLTGQGGIFTEVARTTLFGQFTSGQVPASGGGTTNFLRADGTWVVPTASAAAAGPDRSVQFNSAGALGGAEKVDIDSTGHLRLEVAASPDLPAANHITVTPSKAGVLMPRFRTEDGIYKTMQAHIGRNTVGYGQANGNTATTITFQGMSNLTSVGTLTARNVATTNRMTRSRRIGLVSAATAGQAAGYWNPAAATQYTTGAGAGVGGFKLIWRWAVADAANVAGAHMFVGMRADTAAPVAATSPATFVNSIGVAQVNGSANLQLVYGGSAAQTPIDLGASFPAGSTSVANGALYELILYARPDDATKVGYRVENISTGAIAEGVLSAATAGTQLPASTTLLGPRIFRSNNATAAAVGIDVLSIYIESDM